ncbi:MAG: SoxR reducing system RseC family protein [Odoribacteraceae bacterium]|jgi:sigma-E factor negative regulatory protein RseC|nr:SoxR reducing system RseC family protein [Odoribacteraceae bacterium]
MASSIEHEGVVTRVEGERVTVTIESPTACEGCHARRACGQSGGKTREIVVRHPGGNINAGERVTVRVSGRHAARSVFLAYIVPSVIAIAVVALLSPRAGEVTTAAVALAAIAGYLLLLFACRDALAREITFTLASP